MHFSIHLIVIFSWWVSGAAALTIECDVTAMFRRGNTTMTSIQIRLDDGEESDLVDTESLVLYGLQSLKNTNDSVEYNTTIFVKDSVDRRSTATGRSDETVWNGSLQADDNNTMKLGFATLVQAETGQLSGSFTTSEAAYSIVTLPNGTVQIRATQWNDFPDTDTKAEVEEQPSTKRASRNETATHGESNGGVLMANATFFPDCTSRFTHHRGAQHQHPPSDGRRSLHHSLERSLQEEPNVVVDVLVIVTNTAYCEYAGLERGCDPTDANTAPIRSRMPVIQEQTNSAFSQVDIAVETRIVEVVMLQGTFDGRPTANTLDAMLFDDNVNQWRREVGADLVAMITGADRFTCGIAYLNTHVSATSYACLDRYTFTHELGHNFGANHDRNNVFRSQFHPYGHGFRSEEGQSRYRTVMAYNCPGGCALVPVFSTSSVSLPDGRPLGDTEHDNARLITQNAPRIAAFADTVIANPTTDDSNTTPAPVTAPITAPSATTPTTPTTTTTQELSCPLGPSTVCPDGTNLLSRGRSSRRCRQTCSSERQLFLWFLIGFRCGQCP